MNGYSGNGRSRSDAGCGSETVLKGRIRIYRRRSVAEWGIVPKAIIGTLLFIVFGFFAFWGIGSLTADLLLGLRFVAVALAAIFFYCVVFYDELHYSKKVIIVSALLTVFVVLLSVLVGFVKPVRAAWGELLLNNGSYTQAFDVFNSLGSYEGSRDKAEQIQREHPELTPDRVILENENYIHINALNESSSEGDFVVNNKYRREGRTDNLGSVYGSSLSGDPEGDGLTSGSRREYILDGTYAELRGTVYVRADSTEGKDEYEQLIIYSGDEVIYTSAKFSRGGMYPQDFCVDVSDVERLVVEFTGSKIIGLADCYLYKSAEAASVTTRIKKTYKKSEVGLGELTVFGCSDDGFKRYKSVTDNMDNVYKRVECIGGKFLEENSFEEYYLGGQFDRLVGKVVLNGDYRDASDFTHMWVYGDGKLLYTSPNVTSGMEPTDFDVNISDVNFLRVEVYGRNMVRIIDPHVISDSRKAQTDKELPKMERVALADFEPSKITAENGGLVFYDTLKDNSGVTYQGGFGGSDLNGTSALVYNVDREYGRFEGTVALNYDSRNDIGVTVFMWIYADDELVWQSEVVTRGHTPQDFSIDVSKAKKLKIMIYGKDMLRLVNASLYKK